MNVARAEELRFGILGKAELCCGQPFPKVVAYEPSK
jgi:hypothetical protein